MTDTIDIYGDCGATADAQWNAIWSKWSRQALDAYFASVATWGPLSCGQCEQLIQGVPPSPAGWSRLSACLAEYTSLVTRLREDMARGAISCAPTAAELAAWCDAFNASLPEPLVRALLSPGSTPACAAPQTLVPVSLPLWVPLMPQAVGEQPHKPKRGRPKAAPGTVEAITNRASEILMEKARMGETTTQPALVRAIKAEGLGHGLSDANIISRFKHAGLPTRMAAATAELTRTREREKLRGKFRRV